MKSKEAGGMDSKGAKEGLDLCDKKISSTR
jgi:hypothetical protein